MKNIIEFSMNKNKSLSINFFTQGAKNKSVHSRHSIHFDSVQHALLGII